MRTHGGPTVCAAVAAVRAAVAARAGSLTPDAVRDCLALPARARRLVAAGQPVGQPDYQPSLRLARRRPALVERRSPLMWPPPLAGRSQTIARAIAAMQQLQPSTVHDDAFHE